MEFEVKKRQSETKDNYSSLTLDIAFRFAKEIHKELKDLLKAIVLFGSSARKKEDANDIDLLLIVDDVSVQLTPEMVQAYRIITENTVMKVDPKIHVTSMKFTSFWEYVRAGDPIIINILRDGVALLDSGFFDPLQLLLFQGRIKPSDEALWAYYNRAPRSLAASRKRILEGCIDLYWAVVDSAHAAMMSINEIPPSPSHIADLLEQKLVKTKLIDKKFSWTMRRFYSLSKDIMTGKKQDVTGQEYEKFYKEALDFVKVMEKIIRK